MSSSEAPERVRPARKGEELRMLPDDEVEALCLKLEEEKAAAEAAKKPAVPQ